MDFETANEISIALTVASTKTRAAFKAVVDAIYLKHSADMVPSLADVHSVVDSFNWKFMSKSNDSRSVALIIAAFENYLVTGKEPDTSEYF